MRTLDSELRATCCTAKHSMRSGRLVTYRRKRSQVWLYLCMCIRYQMLMAIHQCVAKAKSTNTEATSNFSIIDEQDWSVGCDWRRGFPTSAVELGPTRILKPVGSHWDSQARRDLMIRSQKHVSFGVADDLEPYGTIFRAQTCHSHF